MARWLDITARHRRFLGLHASVHDFTVNEVGPADPYLIRDDPCLSLYCLDHERREALFTELPADSDLGEAAFVYMVQYQTALRLLAVPYSEFLGVAASLPSIQNFVMIYMTGRSGSTVLSHAFSRVQYAVSLSEPDAPVGLVHLQRRKAASAEELQALFDASCRLLFRGRDGAMPGLCVLKMRNESIQLAELIRSAYPDGRSLFIYRDAVGWVGSMYRIFMRLELPEWWSVRELSEEFDLCYGFDADRFLPLLDRESPEVNVIELLTLWWVAVIESYCEATERGLKATAFRHEDIAFRPEQSLPEVFRCCGLSAADARRAISVYERDSQAGTPQSRATTEEEHLRLTAEQCDLIKAIVSRHPLIHDAWIDVPGTVRF